jgi:hypothetical protein
VFVCKAGDNRDVVFENGGLIGVMATGAAEVVVDISNSVGPDEGRTV